MFSSIILGLLQGLAEFLPISSSGHLVIGKAIFGMSEVGMFFDLMLHVGTLASIFVVFRKKLWKIIVGLIQKDLEQWKYIFYVFIASIPTAMIGLGFKDALEALFIKPKAVSAALLFTGVLLFLTRYAKESSHQDLASMNWWKAILTGVVQGIACIPGISRSGSTISSMLFLKVDRKFAGEFSFLMSIPAVGGAALLDFIQWFQCQGAKASLDACQNMDSFSAALLAGMFVAFISGLFALRWLISFVQKGKFYHFSWYLWIVGLLGLFLF
jgi:undecaprenyl-diphosphatase